MNTNDAPRSRRSAGQTLSENQPAQSVKKSAWLKEMKPCGATARMPWVVARSLSGASTISFVSPKRNLAMMGQPRHLGR